MPLHKASQMSKVFLFLLAGAVLTLSACDLPFGIGSPTTRALESGAATSLQQRTFEVTGVYTQTVVAPAPPIVSGARVSAPAVGTRWSIDLQLSNQMPARRMSVSNGDVKLDAIVLPSVAYFSGQAFLLQFLGGDPRSRDLASAFATLSWVRRSRRARITGRSTASTLWSFQVRARTCTSRRLRPTGCCGWSSTSG